MGWQHWLLHQHGLLLRVIAGLGWSGAHGSHTARDSHLGEVQGLGRELHVLSRGATLLAPRCVLHSERSVSLVLWDFYGGSVMKHDWSAHGHW